MKQLVTILGILVWLVAPLQAQDCLTAAKELKLPVKFKTRGKPKVARWEQVDKTLNDLVGKLSAQECALDFSQVFQTNEKELYFPLTNSVLRLVPENTFQALMVFTKDGEELGPFEGRVRYDRSGGLYARKSYSLYYFQYKSPQGSLETVGKHLLLDEFLVKWEDIQSKTAISTSPGTP